MKRMTSMIVKTKMEQREVIKKLSSLKNLTTSIENDLNRIRQTQTEIEIDLERISRVEGPATVHQIGDNYFWRKRKHQLLNAVIQERKKLEKLHQIHMEKVNSMKSVLTSTTKLLGRLNDKTS